MRRLELTVGAPCSCSQTAPSWRERGRSTSPGRSRPGSRRVRQPVAAKRPQTPPAVKRTRFSPGAREAGAALPGNEAVVCAHRRLAEDETQAFAGARLGPKTRLLRPERQKRHLRYRSSMPSAGGSRVPGAPPTAASPRCAVPMPPDAGDRSPVAGPPRSRCLRRQARPPQRRSRRRCRLRRQATAFSSSRPNPAWRSAGG